MYENAIAIFLPSLSRESRHRGQKWVDPNRSPFKADARRKLVRCYLRFIWREKKEKNSFYNKYELHDKYDERSLWK